MPTRTSQLMGRLPFPNLLNARDLGGHPTRDGKRTRWKAFLRSDDLCYLTAEGERALRAYGVRTVVDLRWPEEVRARPSVFQARSSDVAYHHVSLLKRTEAEWRTTTPDTPKEGWNRLILDHAGPEIGRALAVMAAAPPGGVLFHCFAGKDRTGLIASLLLALADVEVDSITQDYTRSAGCLKDAYLAARPSEEPEVILEEIRCPEEQVPSMMEHLRTVYGGARGYLRRIGLGEAEIQSLVDRLRE